MFLFLKSSAQLRSLLVLLVLTILLPFVAMAQVESETWDASLDSGEVVTYTTLSNAMLIAQNADSLIISFDIENAGPRPQSDIRYGVDLIREEGAPGAETQVIVDSLVAEEVVTLSAGERASKVVIYDIAGIPPGTYDVFVSAQTTGGALIGIGSAGEVTIEESDAVEIIAESCVLNVVGEAGTSYDLYQGVDVAPEEDITLTCTLKNHGTASITVLPDFVTYERNIYGEEVAVAVPTKTPITLGAGAEERESFIIPKATAPQAYDVVLSLRNEMNAAIISNKLVAHYVIQGVSASIQTVNFDKNAYRAGESINLVLNWTGAADTFEDSRAGGGTDIGAITAVSQVRDGQGSVCSPETRTVLTDTAVTVSSQSRIDCIKPAATIQLVAADGTVLDSLEIAVDDSETLEGGTTMAPQAGSKDRALMFAAIVALTITLLVLLLERSRHKKIDFIDASKMLFIGTVAAAGFFGVNVEQASAITWVHNYSNSKGNHAVNVTVNPNKTVFSPGETIYLTSRVVSASCLNGRTPAYRLRAYLGSQMSTLGYMTVNTTSHNGGGTLIAPTVPGTYTIRLEMVVLSYVSYRDITITVTAPVPPAPASITATCNAPGDPASISWSPVSGATYYAFRISPGSIVTNVNGTSYNTFIPTLGTNYATWVHACNASGCSAGVAATNFMCNAAPTPPPAPTATISVDPVPCYIQAGDDECTVDVTWDIDNATSPNVFNTFTNSVLSSSPAATQATSLVRGFHTFVARDGSSAPLDSASVAVDCVAGTSWNGSSCELVPVVPDEPSISIMLDRELIRSGETVDATVDVEAPYAAECTVYGVEGTPFVFMHNGTPARPASSDTFTSRPLTAAQVITVTCVPTPANGASDNTANSRVNVIPVIEEI